MQPIGGSAYNPASGPNSFSSGPAAAGGVVVLHNFSPYDLSIEFNNDAVRQGFLPAWTYRTYDFKGAQTSTISYSIYYSPSLDIVNAAPSSYVYGESFAPGEEVPSPVINYNRVANIGNGIQLTSATDTFEEDFISPFVFAGITPGGLGTTQYTSTAGIAFLIQSDGSIRRRAYGPVSQTVNYTSTTMYHDINPDGSYSFAASHSTQANYLTIATVVYDNTSKISSITDTRFQWGVLFPGFSNVAGNPGLIAYNLHIYKNIQADNQISVQGNYHTSSPFTGLGWNVMADSGSNLEFEPDGNAVGKGIYFYIFPTLPGVGTVPFSIGYQLNNSGSWIDLNGALHSTSPVVLIPSIQETGTTGCYFQAAAGSNFSGGPTNFKTVMTNTPSSISISNSAIQNVSSTGIEKITFYGFTFFAVSTAAGITKWEGTYTTVGNCLLKVDAILGVFDHHCDGCGNITTSNPISSLESLTADSLSYICSKCGMQECFNTDLTQEDENDQTIQGSGDYATTRGAQATMIRSLMTMVGMKTA